MHAQTHTPFIVEVDYRFQFDASVKLNELKSTVTLLKFGNLCVHWRCSFRVNILAYVKQWQVLSVTNLYLFEPSIDIEISLLFSFKF